MSFDLPVRVYWEDTDAGGVVFYANYLKYLERARTEWLRSLGLEQNSLLEHTGGMFMVSRVEIKYHRPARLDDALQVSARVHKQGAASLWMAQQVHRLNASSAVSVPSSQTPELLCDALVRIGWVDGTSMRPTKMPPFILEKITGDKN